MKSLLYPLNNAMRRATQLNGLWKFVFDPAEVGESLNYQNGFQSDIELPVPSSFNDFFTEREQRDYTGTFWYAKEIFIHATKQQLILRFSAATHHAIVYVNGMKVKEHQGGFLPFEIDITSVVRKNNYNQIVVQMNNEISNTTLPAGEVDILPDGRKITEPYFDFFNYAGLIRPVWLLEVPAKRIIDLNQKVTLGKQQATLTYEVVVNNENIEQVEVLLKDQNKQTVAQSNQLKGELVINQPHLWEVRNAYLYQLEVNIKDEKHVIDTYQWPIGLRTIKVQHQQIFLNDKPIYLKGFGKHEDSDFYGRGYNPAVIKRDFELMKWSHANSFRTSHYPYSEEIYQIADKEGFLIIDEVPAVGFMKTTNNFLAAGTGAKMKSFFDSTNLELLQQRHLSDISDLIQRDKNHPSVIAWSLMNEPDTATTTAEKYFDPIFVTAKELDPEQRPRTFTLVLKDTPDVSKCYQYADFLCLNRYYGWYIDGGDRLKQGYQQFKKEISSWEEVAPNKPIVITEFGADALNGLTQLPSSMWSEEYQQECVKMCMHVFDEFDSICGEQIWNFADFATTESVFRVAGNKKGVFTRDRQPKRIAYLLKERWQKMGEDAKIFSE